MTIRIAPITPEHIPGFHAVLDAVARERRYIGLTQAFPPPATAAYVQQMLAGGGVHFVALADNGDVVGWCDIERQQLEGFRHVGRLGMGLLPAYRHQGNGRRLALAAISASRVTGVERIELEVFASNTAAVRLYEHLGFVQEGVKRGARRLDGRSDDTILMALIGEPRIPDGPA